jgi:hypothetical protein
MSGGPAVPRSSSGPWPIMGSAPPFVGRPVHEPWPGGKLPERVVRAVAQPHADSPGASRPPLMGRFQLARVAQPVAVATGEHAPDDVQPDDPASTATALEPRPLADCKASRQWRCAAHGPRISPLRRRAHQARAAEGSHPGAYRTHDGRQTMRSQIAPWRRNATMDHALGASQSRRHQLREGMGF